MGRKEQFSHAGLTALYEYLAELEEDTGSETELDVIAICCEYSEYETAVDAAEEYSLDYEPGDADDETEANALEALKDRTTVIEFDGGVIIADF